MAKKPKTKRLNEATDEELVAELARRRAQDLPEDFTMTDVELAVMGMRDEEEPPKLAAMLARMKPEKPTAKACPRCGKRVAVRARDRERTVRSLAGPVTFRRNYHYCEKCRYGFYPVDRLLDLPEEGELTSEMEKRVLDLAVNGPFEHIAERWSVHYSSPISSNLARQVIRRVGHQCECADELELQRELVPPSPRPAPLLVVETDGSLLPMRGSERWKEAKVAVVVRSDRHLPGRSTRRGRVTQSRYVAVLGDQDEFAHSLGQVLEAEDVGDVETVVWLGDGAPENWTLADRLTRGNTVEILDCQHAIENGMKAGRELLGEESPLLPVWQKRVEQLVYAGTPERLIREVLDCILEADDEGLSALDDLVRYYRANANRMEYAAYVERGLPIGSGIVESAHRHVLQSRMKLAGQHWSREGARRMARLRAAYRTAGPRRFHSAIRRVGLTIRPHPPRFPGRELRLGETAHAHTRHRASNYGVSGVRIRLHRRRRPSN
jgi:hypothetical protein